MKRHFKDNTCVLATLCYSKHAISTQCLLRKYLSSAHPTVRAYSHQAKVGRKAKTFKERAKNTKNKRQA